VTLPELRLLGYQERKPMLRVVRLPDATIEPAPVSLDTGYALDECLRRDGWLAFEPNNVAWGISAQFDEQPFLIGRDAWHISPALDPATIWFRSREKPVLTEYDGRNRRVRRELELPLELADEWARPVGEVASGLLIGGDSGLFEWQPPAEPRLLLDGFSPAALEPIRQTVVCLGFETGELVLYDVGRATMVSVPKPEGARWPLFPTSFSPDGAWLAVDLDYSPESSDEELDQRLKDVIRGRSTYEPVEHRLGIIRCADGAMTIADGSYDNFAKLVWSLDSEWVVFNTAFDERCLWVTRPAEPALERLELAESVPSLLCDVSDLVP
jgi:hypothetical protein